MKNTNPGLRSEKIEIILHKDYFQHLRETEDFLTKNHKLHMKKRYQDCNKLTKLWRRRWYLMVPIWVLKSVLNGTLEHNDVNLKMLWNIYIGIAQGKMEWWYTMDEVKEMIGYEG